MVSSVSLRGSRRLGSVLCSWTAGALLIVSVLVAVRVYRRMEPMASPDQDTEGTGTGTGTRTSDESSAVNLQQKESVNHLGLLKSNKRNKNFEKPDPRESFAEEKKDSEPGAEAGAGSPSSSSDLGLPPFDPNRHHADPPTDDDPVDPIPFQGRHPEHSTLSLLQVPTVSCQHDETLLMIIFSRPEGRGSRSAIRKTWARYDPIKYPTVQMKWLTVFVMGKTRNDWLSREIEEENRREGDILQGDFEDGLFEDTSKFMLTLEWTNELTANTRCRQLHYVIKSVDNIFHNMVAITGWLEAKYPPGARKRLYVGKRLRKDSPIRDPRHPLFVARGDFAGDHFPDLIQGPVYMFSYDVLVEMGRSMGRVKPVAMEDGYVGLLASTCQVQPQHNDHFQMLSHIRDGCHHLRMFFVYNVLPNDHLIIYDSIDQAQQSKRCPPPPAGPPQPRIRHVEA